MGVRTCLDVSARLVVDTLHATPAGDFRFALVNDGPGRVGFGLAFDVQRVEGERWVDTSFVPDAVAAVGLSLTPGQTFEQHVEIPAAAPPGRYRVRKWVEGGGGFLTCEFVIELSGG